MYACLRIRLLGLICLSFHSLPLMAVTPVQVIVASVEQKQLTNKLEALGTLRARESIQLTAAVTETVSHIHFDDGARVNRGQILVEMTSTEEHAQLEEARATLKEASSQFNRVKSLAAEGTAAKSLLDERKRELETARAKLSAIVSRLEDRVIRAPFSGIVGLRNISVGALVEPGDLITTLDDDSQMKLDFSVSSVYLKLLRSGLQIVARTRAWPEKEFIGEVKSVDSRIDPVTRSIIVRAVLPNPEHQLKPGMLMQIDILTSPRSSLTIPESALLPQGTKQYVLVVDVKDNNKVVRREVIIGQRYTGSVEILNGISAGEKVITHGTLKTLPGKKVIIRAEDDGNQPLAKLLKQNQSKTSP